MRQTSTLIATYITHKDTVRGIFCARLQDTTASVLEELYSNPSVITPIFASDSKAYLSNLSLAIDSQSKTKRNILRLHFLYLTQFFWSATETSVREEAFHQIIFPFLLFSKPRQKTAELVWDLIGEHIMKTSESLSIEWLDDCIALVKSAATTQDTDSVDVMNQLNQSVAEKIAGKVSSSPLFT